MNDVGVDICGRIELRGRALSVARTIEKFGLQDRGSSSFACCGLLLHCRCLFAAVWWRSASNGGCEQLNDSKAKLVCEGRDKKKSLFGGKSPTGEARAVCCCERPICTTSCNPIAYHINIK